MQTESKQEKTLTNWRWGISKDTDRKSVNKGYPQTGEHGRITQDTRKKQANGGNSLPGWHKGCNKLGHKRK